MKAMAQARTDAQASTARGLMVLGDDCVHKVMTFLAVADARRGVGATAKAFRTTAMSTTLARTRSSEPYKLRAQGETGRGDKHGVVHAMATAMGTRRWPTRAVRINNDGDEWNGAVAAAAVPPARLGITFHRGRTHWGGNWSPDGEPYASYAASAIVDQVMARDICGGGECTVRTGSFVQYDLPFQLKITAFSLGISACRSERFTDWTFEAFDGENWRQLCNFTGTMSAERRTFWRVGAADRVASNRFRIRLAETGEPYRCMHIRGLELLGTVLPPWRID